HAADHAHGPRRELLPEQPVALDSSHPSCQRDPRRGHRARDHRERGADDGGAARPSGVDSAHGASSDGRGGGDRRADRDGWPRRVDWAVAGWEVADALLAAHAGLGVPRDPVALYLFADGDSFRRLTSQLTGLPLAAVRQFEGGRSYTAGGRRGVYLNAGAVDS